MKFPFGRLFPRHLRPRRRPPSQSHEAACVRPYLERLESREVPSCGLVTWPPPYNVSVLFPLPPPNSNVIGVCNTNDSGGGSLRDAITTLNSLPPPQPPYTNYIILFSIPGPQPHTIHLLSPLPPLNNVALFDTVNYQLDYTGRPVIELDGSRAGANANGLVLNAGSSAVNGLIINNFGGSGIVVQGQGNNFISGNYIGTDFTGTLSKRNTVGITVRGGAGNHISQSVLIDSFGFTRLPSNLISGNVQEGILLTGSTVTSNEVDKNLIGTNYLGTGAIPNGTGIAVSQGASGTRIRYNLISGNIGAGISIRDHNSRDNRIAGNLIGTDRLGESSIPNATGVEINQAVGTALGRPAATEGNLISGNTLGVSITDVHPNPDEVDTTIRNNIIGLNRRGTGRLGNAQGGILVQNSTRTVIGSRDVSFSNTISANGGQGILLAGGSSENTILGNFIGTDFLGTVALGNLIGVLVQGSPNNIIGGNLISGNSAAGVSILLEESTGNRVLGNFIGTGADGTTAVPNGTGVVVTQGAADTLIGGASPAAANLIADNNGNGITISDVATRTLVQGNTITQNHANGVALVLASGNTIGGIDPGEGNTITQNGVDGVLVDTGTGNAIRGNSIGVHPHHAIELINGGNMSRNYPILTSAGTDTTQNVTTVTGVLFAPANSLYNLDFYFSPTPNPDGGFGPGVTYLGTITVMTSDIGFVEYTATFDGSMTPNGVAPPGSYVTATQTDLAGNTSTFAYSFLVSDQTTGPDGAAQGAVVAGGPEPSGAEAAALAQALPVNRDRAPILVVSPGAPVEAVSPGGGDPLSRPAVDSLFSRLTEKPAGRKVHAPVLAASPEAALEGTASDAFGRLSQDAEGLG